MHQWKCAVLHVRRQLKLQRVRGQPEQHVGLVSSERQQLMQQHNKSHCSKHMQWRSRQRPSRRQRWQRLSRQQVEEQRQGNSNNQCMAVNRDSSSTAKCKEAQVVQEIHRRQGVLRA